MDSKDLDLALEEWEVEPIRAHQANLGMETREEALNQNSADFKDFLGSEGLETSVDSAKTTAILIFHDDILLSIFNMCNCYQIKSRC